MKILPKYMLFLPQGANIQGKSSFKTKPNQKDWQKKKKNKKVFQLSFEKNPTMNIKPPKNII